MKYVVESKVSYTEYRYIEADSKEDAIAHAMDAGIWEKNFDEDIEDISAEEVSDEDWKDYHS